MLQYCENRPRDSRFEYSQARWIRPLQDQTCFRIAWLLQTNIKCFRQVSMIIFLDILKTDSCVTPVRCWKQWEFTSTIESTSNQGQCLKSLEISKEAFYVFRRIKSEDSWKRNKFKTVMYPPLSKHFPAAWSLPQNTAYFAFCPDFSHLFSDLDIGVRASGGGGGGARGGGAPPPPNVWATQTF